MSSLPFGLKLFLAALSLIPALVYLDAAEHGIGKNPQAGRSLPAGAWAAWALIPGVGYLGVIAYLINRNEMLGLAAIHPVTVPRTRMLITFFLILAASAIITQYWWLVIRQDQPEQEIPIHRQSGKQDTPFYLDRSRIDDDR
jgi:hypothetical protein